MNWKRIAVTGLVAGMVAATGCSTNLPETNQGNRNGQRVADAVNRREDTYRTTSNRLAYTEGNDVGNGLVGRTTRGVRRAADNVTNSVANTVNHAKRNTNHIRPNTHRVQGRIGNTYRYGGERTHVEGMRNAVTHGYDMGVTAQEQATVNTRVTRSTTPTKRVDTKRDASKKVDHKETTTHTTQAAPAITPRIVRQAPTIKPATRRHANTTTRSSATRNTGNRNNHRQVTRKQARKHATTANQHNRYGMNLNNRYATGNVLGLNAIPEQTVAVINHDDHVVTRVNDDDMAFFRKKTEEPTTPEVTPAPAITPAETSDESFDESYDDTYHRENAQQEPTTQPTNPEPTPNNYRITTPNNTPTRTVPKRAMK